MKPILQTIFTPGHGDCFSASLASILELELDDVPKFRRDNPEPGNMMKAARAWLADRFNLSLITVQLAETEESGADMRIVGAFSFTPCIAGGKSPNISGGMHAVVGEIDCWGNFHLLHDPHPLKQGIDGPPLHLYFFVPLNPAEAARHPCKRVIRLQGKF